MYIYRQSGIKNLALRLACFVFCAGFKSYATACSDVVCWLLTLLLLVLMLGADSGADYGTPQTDDLYDLFPLQFMI